MLRDEDGDRRCEQPPPGWDPEPQGIWLTIRADAADLGARPLPAGEVFWESPDIHVIGGDPLGNPRVGHPVTLEARVWNRGAVDANPLRVDFAYVAPSLGILPAAPQPIGTAWSAVPAGQSTIVRCPGAWTPPSYPTDLHACLLATCSAPTRHDGPSAPANPAADRHVGQRNLTVLEAPAGAALRLRLGLANLAAHEAETGLAVAAAWHDGDTLVAPPLGVLDAAEAATRARRLDDARMWSGRAALLATGARAAHEPLSGREVDRLVSVRALEAGERSPRPAIPPAARGLARSGSFAPLAGTLRLASAQTGTAELELRIPAAPLGPRLAVRVAQRNADGTLTGGYTVVAQIEGAAPAPTRREGGAPMQSGHKLEDEVRRHVVGHVAHQRVVAQVAAQLADHLPLTSPQHLGEVLDRRGALDVGRERHELAALAQRVPPSVFPIADLEDLVRKTDAAVRLADTAARRGLASEHPETGRLARAVAAAAAAQWEPPPAGAFRGPSLFGMPTAQEGA